MYVMYPSKLLAAKFPHCWNPIGSIQPKLTFFCNAKDNFDLLLSVPSIHQFYPCNQTIPWLLHYAARPTDEERESLIKHLLGNQFQRLFCRLFLFLWIFFENWRFLCFVILFLIYLLDDCVLLLITCQVVVCLIAKYNVSLNCRI